MPGLVADWVRQNRVARRWTQAQLANRMGTVNSNVSRWERGANDPTLEQFRALCVAFSACANDALGLRWRKRPPSAAEARA